MIERIAQDPPSVVLEEIARKHGVLLLLQFGSSITGRLHTHSDIDLAVQLRHPPESLVDFAELIHDLQQLFPDREVDVVVLNRADPLLLRKITEACRLLYGPSRALRELEIYAFKRHRDHRRYFAMERRYVARALHSPSP